MAKQVIAQVSEVPPGARKIVEVAGRSIGVFNVAGEFFALRNRCPHQGGPLCTGRLSGFLPGDSLADETSVPAPGLIRGPYVAETYAVAVEQEYVVVEVPG